MLCLRAGSHVWLLCRLKEISHCVEVAPIEGNRVAPYHGNRLALFGGNQVALNGGNSAIGNVGALPEVRGKTQDNKAITTFSLAQSVFGYDSETKERVKKEPQWFQVSCFGVVAERTFSSLSKGDMILVNGELKSRSYLNAAGEKRISFEVVAHDVFRVETLLKKEASQYLEQDIRINPQPDFNSFTAQELKK